VFLFTELIDTGMLQQSFRVLSQSGFTGVSVNDIKDHLNITDTSKDVYLQSLIATAVGIVERRIGLDLRTTTYAMQLDRFPCYIHPGILDNYYYGQWYYYQANIGRSAQRHQSIYMVHGPLSSITSIVYYDANNVQQTLASDQYAYNAPSFFPAVLEPVTVWPVAYARPDAVTITFVTGMSSIPDNLKHAIKLVCGMLNADREGIIYGPQTAMGNTGMAVDNILDQFTVFGVA
jgi:hypothetical protein